MQAGDASLLTSLKEDSVLVKKSESYFIDTIFYCYRKINYLQLIEIIIIITFH